jgi:hypothetical protein
LSTEITAEKDKENLGMYLTVNRIVNLEGIQNCAYENESDHSQETYVAYVNILFIYIVKNITARFIFEKITI